MKVKLICILLLFIHSTLVCAEEGIVVGTVATVSVGSKGKPVPVASVSVYRNIDECESSMRIAAYPIYKKALDEGRFVSVSFSCHQENDYGAFEMEPAISTIISE
ncbi:hypothetical protein TspCOW1_11620 [Thiohalobacter sp. COW1]|uniref:hypothetical protein n=1 Tax=Thiohalobacter sp. COW1 TaxID=2795687 RepID=UPI00191694CC|nr:hypothetical protein [Thiohalobacter sp. COW1]BCO31059.1 hypothetical protein TspCOW1_11620 [Thiohalobacter sp. COW1]